LHRPSAYQLDNAGAQKPVNCRFAIDSTGEVRFRLGAYDHSREVVVDPVLDFLTYLGGSGVDQITAIGADSEGNVIVAGSTSSVNFPGAGAPANSTAIFVSKLNATGTSLLFTTLLGAQYQPPLPLLLPPVSSLAVDTDGSIYVTGQTSATNFPTSSGAFQQNGAGQSDFFEWRHHVDLPLRRKQRRTEVRPEQDLHIGQCRRKEAGSKGR
jgi:hypothetical protein